MSRKLTKNPKKGQLSTYISVKPALMGWHRLLSRKLSALSELGWWYTAQILTWHSIHSSLRACLSNRQKGDHRLASWFIQARNATGPHHRLSFHPLNQPQSRRANPPPIRFHLRFPHRGSGTLICAAFGGKPNLWVWNLLSAFDYPPAIFIQRSRLRLLKDSPQILQHRYMTATPDLP